MIDPVTTPVLLFVEVSGGLERMMWADRLVLRELLFRDDEFVRGWLTRRANRAPQMAEVYASCLAILDAITHLDILALQSCDVGRLASAVRDDLSALPALLDALEETGRGNDRRVVAVLGDTGVIA